MGLAHHITVTVDCDMMFAGERPGFGSRAGLIDV
jgi:hypothetical protein